MSPSSRAFRSHFLWFLYGAIGITVALWTYVHHLPLRQCFPSIFF